MTSVKTWCTMLVALENPLETKHTRKQERIWIAVQGDLKKRIRAVAVAEAERTGYPITMSSFIRRAVEEAVARVEEA